MKKLIVILSIVTYTHVTAQLNEQNPRSTVYERVYIETGLVQPLGDLSNQLGTSPSFGFWFRNRLIRHDFVDFGFNFFIPTHAASPIFKYHSTTVKYSSERFAINFGTRFAKVLPLFGAVDKWQAEWNSGIGVALNFYKAPENLSFANGEHTNEVLTTCYLSQGIRINYKNIGFQCQYHWVPYSLFNERLQRDYGSQLLMLGIAYKQ